ncbi:hypothetical protein JCM19000A_33840 [Silvimonas sp. JCM 19000]
MRTSLKLILLTLSALPAWASAKTLNDRGVSITYSDNMTITSPHWSALSTGVYRGPDNVGYPYVESRVGAYVIVDPVASGDDVSATYSVTFNLQPGWMIEEVDLVISGSVSGSSVPTVIGNPTTVQTGSATSYDKIQPWFATSTQPGNPDQVNWESWVALDSTPAPPSTGYTSETATIVLNWSGTNQNISFNNTNFGINLIKFGNPIGTLPPVPEPETWALMGLGVIGLIARQRKQKAAHD